MFKFPEIVTKYDARLVVSEYMKENNPIVRYVRTVSGFPFGVVVGIGYNRVGWSMVNHSESKYRFFAPHQLPALQRLTEMNRNGKFVDIFKTDAYINLVANDMFLPYPKFDRDTGLIEAIKCAENCEVTVMDGTPEPKGKVPVNPEMLYAVKDMIARTWKVQRFITT